LTTTTFSIFAVKSYASIIFSTNPCVLAAKVTYTIATTIDNLEYILIFLISTLQIYQL